MATAPQVCLPHMHQQTRAPMHPIRAHGALMLTQGTYSHTQVNGTYSHTQVNGTYSRTLDDVPCPQKKRDMGHHQCHRCADG